MRDIPWPEELVFSLDQKMLNDIAYAKEQYYKQVCSLCIFPINTDGFFTFGMSVLPVPIDDVWGVGNSSDFSCTDLCASCSYFNE